VREISTIEVYGTSYYNEQFVGVDNIKNGSKFKLSKVDTSGLRQGETKVLVRLTPDLVQ